MKDYGHLWRQPSAVGADANSLESNTHTVMFACMLHGLAKGVMTALYIPNVCPKDSDKSENKRFFISKVLQSEVSFVCPIQKIECSLFRRIRSLNVR